MVTPSSARASGAPSAGPEPPAATESASHAKLLTNAAWHAAATICTLFLALISSALVARYLGPASLGLLGLAQSVRLTLLMLLDVGLASAATKFVAELHGAGRPAEAESVGRLLTIAQVVLATTAGLTLSVTSVAVAQVLGQADVAPLLPIAALGLSLTLFNAVLAGRLLGLQQFRLKSNLDAAAAVLSLASTLVVIANHGTVEHLLWVDVGVAAFQSALLLSRPVLWRARSLAGTVNRPLGWQLVRYCSGVFLMTAFEAIIWQRTEVFFLARFGATTDIAFYSVAFTLATIPVTLIPFSLAAALLPFLAARFGSQGSTSFRSVYASATKYSAIIALPICAIGMGLAGLIVRVVYGEAYEPAATVLRILLIGAALGAMCAPGSNVFLALGQPGTRAIWGIPIAAMNVGLAIILIPPLGAVGAALAKSSSQAVHVLADTLFLLMARGARLPAGQLARIGMAATAVGLIAYASTLLLAPLPSILLSCLVGIVYVPSLVFLRVFDTTDFEVFMEVVRAGPAPLQVLLLRTIRRAQRVAGAGVATPFGV